MKKEFNQQLFENTFNKHKSLLVESLLDRDEDFGDGYSNDAQRAFAHSQTTTPRKNDTKKAQELAKQGKYVVVVEAPVYCKSTDGCLGTSVSIEKVCSTREEAEKEQEKFNAAEFSDLSVRIISPEDFKPKQQKDAASTENDDVPFESVGNNKFKLKEANSAPDKLVQKERNAIGSAFAKAGVDGNGRFTSVGKGLSAVAFALDSVGFNLDMVSGDLVLGDKGSRMLPFRRKSPDATVELPEIKNSRIVFNWEKLEDNFEIQCYAS
jgi:hypothetical protein